MERLNYFIEHNKIPNIIFHGPPGSGKKTLLDTFIHRIYTNKENLQECVMRVNCAYGKGIKFMREEIKHFSKTKTKHFFKSILLLNAEKLTPDAQFALRRCIEEFSHNTRYFIVTIDKYKLIKPILSRFSEIYISSSENLHQLSIRQLNFDEYEQDRCIDFTRIMETLHEKNIHSISTQLTDQAYSVFDLEQYIETMNIPSEDKYKWFLYASKIKSEIINEKLLFYVLLHFLLFRKEMTLNLFI